MAGLGPTRGRTLLLAVLIAASLTVTTNGETTAPFPGAYSDGDLDALQDFGFTATHAAAWSQAEFDALADRGMHGIAWTGAWLRSSCRFELPDRKVKRWLERIRDHPALYAVQLSDEPRQAPSEEGCSNAVSAHKARRELIARSAPGVPTFITLDATQTEHLRAWKGAADLYGLVLYPCTFDDRTCDYSLISSEVKVATRAGLTNLVGVVQTFGNRWARMPSPRELDRMLATWRAADVDRFYYYAFSGYEPQGIENTAAIHQAVRARIND